MFYIMTTTPNAKINLGLRVGGLRPDGYHDIETVFLPYFGLCDSLEIVRGDDFSRTLAGLISKYGGTDSLGERPFCEGVTFCGDGNSVVGGCGDKIRQGMTADGKCMITIAREEGVDWEPIEDLCVKAYMALDADFALPPVKIILEKLIPVGAGLGGGSSDGAFALKMLSEMFGLGLGGRQLAEYASRLGSDCAFFVENIAAFAQGRGEVLTPIEIPQLDDYEIQVVVPQGVHISTAKAYKEIDEGTSSVNPSDHNSECDSTNASPAVSVAGSEEGSSKDGEENLHSGCTSSTERLSLLSAVRRPVEEWKNLMVNDFEKPVFAQEPQLAEIKRSLYDCGAAFAFMSGTGSAIYGIFPK